MATTTQFQQFTKPGYSDPADIAVLDANYDLIDKIGTVICTSTTRPSTNLFAGLTIYETDTKFRRIYNGSSWDPGQAICTNATHPSSNLIFGDVILETDTKRYFGWDGGAWRLISDMDYKVYNPATTGASSSPVAFAKWKFIADRLIHFQAGFSAGTVTTTGVSPTIALPTGIIADALTGQSLISFVGNACAKSTANGSASVLTLSTKGPTAADTWVAGDALTGWRCYGTLSVTGGI